MQMLRYIMVAVVLMSSTVWAPDQSVYADDAAPASMAEVVETPPVWNHGEGVGLYAIGLLSSVTMLALTAQWGAQTLEDDGDLVEASLLSVFGYMALGPLAAAGSVAGFGHAAGYRGDFWAAMLGAEVGVWFGLGFTTLVLWRNDEIDIRDLRTGDAFLLLTLAPALTTSAGALIGFVVSRDSRAEVRERGAHTSSLHYVADKGWQWSLPAPAIVPGDEGVSVHLSLVSAEF